MKTLLVGACDPERTYRLSDPDAPGEAEFEYTVVAALACAYPAYKCVLFGGTFVFDGDARRPDLALVARDLSHWFVVEVELVTHSLEHHVLPQVRAFTYGTPQADCVSALADRLGLDRERAKTLVHLVPRSVAVVANKRDLDWSQTLRGLGTQMLVVSKFHTPGGQVAVEIEGELQVVSASLGFATFSAVDRSLRLPATSRLRSGTVQLVDPAGGPSLWTVAESQGTLWITKDVGTPDFPDGAVIQLVRTVDGRLCLRRPGA